jgi:hypothetical protein
MPEEVLTIVKVPLSEIAESYRSKHTLPSKLTEARIEGDSLILSFTEETADMEESPTTSSTVQNPHRKRRSRRKRNRMKTRGWAPVERIVNSKGQKCTIYKPFVDALQNQQLTPEEQRKKVESILRANRNRPSEESVEYFLSNTLEYLKRAV